MKSNTQPKLEKILWRDASAISNQFVEWNHLDTLIEKGRALFNEYVITAGYVIFRSKDFLIVAGTMTGSGPQALYSDVSMIPTALVISPKRKK